MDALRAELAAESRSRHAAEVESEHLQHLNARLLEELKTEREWRVHVMHVYGVVQKNNDKLLIEYKKCQESLSVVSGTCDFLKERLTEFAGACTCGA